ncbi:MULTISPECIES: CynX/NimT family MFS transporter [Chryseobacterium]|uniref:CynX/NimT family MFS transporter n=1 Tax=Chryseobacterium TaxID=59732 RepID=UPI000F992A83|nr:MULTISPECIES: MFS transporter [Chryseobacterium]MBM7421103.1 CP family cyanate transporter-like MFS transporter [Chryseobacterium sp. JUb44]MDH6211062.1 CP family cyanate transporter-like MFS transporter [Chryseobacterium sp. BIGb0186]WSO09726.1 MFS transporter [Chryseobacterium scophthalmum]
MRNKIRRDFSYILLIINVLVLVLVSSNLRSPITSVGPVLNQISNSLHLNNLQSSMLTSIPLLMFASCSVLVSKFSHRFSINRFLLYALIILSFGLFMRVFGSVWTLFTGSVLIGLGVCIGNVITPGYIKNNFPKQIGLMTGIFAVSMNLTAALASGYSVSLGEWTGYGWRGSLGIWLVIALLALFVVAVELLLNKSRVQQTGASLVKSDFNMFKSKQAWNISIFMGLQSLVYYSLISWLPAVLGDYGMQGNEPGWILFIIQISMIPITFVGPIIANKMKNQKTMIVFIFILMLASVLMFAWLKSEWIYATAVLLGLSNGLSFSLSILFFSLRTRSSANAIKISGMAQSVGYLIAAFGPVIFGKLHDFDSSWKWSFYFLGLSITTMFYFGMKAARRKFVED